MAGHWWWHIHGMPALEGHLRRRGVSGGGGLAAAPVLTGGWWGVNVSCC